MPAVCLPLMFAVTLMGCQPATPTGPVSGTDAAAKQAIITVVIDDGTGDEPREERVDWRPGINVLDALLATGSENLEIRHRGSGITAFVEAIGDNENTGSGKNWLFYVNQQKAPEGAGASELQPGDIVLWKYTDEK